MQTFDRTIAAHWKTIANNLPVAYLYETGNGVCDPADCGTDAEVDRLAGLGVEVFGPPVWTLVTSQGHRMVPTTRSEKFQAMGAVLTPWTLERSGCLENAIAFPGPCGWYYQGLADSAYEYADVLLLMYSLYHEVHVDGVFSDFPATNTAFLNCVPKMGEDSSGLVNVLNTANAVTWTDGVLASHWFPKGASCPWTTTPETDADCIHNQGLMTHIKDSLDTCGNNTLAQNDMSIGHRGAAMVAPEHTMASYKLAADMGAGFIECDVAITKDQHLVCRHSQCDLHTTTDILKGAHSDLADKCSVPFTAATAAPTNAAVRCCTYDFTIAELETLCMTMDESTNSQATTAAEYTVGAPSWRSDVMVADECHKIVRHQDMAAWLIETGHNAIPELKDTHVAETVTFLTSVGMTKETFANKLTDELKAAGFTNSMSGRAWVDPLMPKVSET